MKEKNSNNSNQKIPTLENNTENLNLAKTGHDPNSNLFYMNHHTDNNNDSMDEIENDEERIAALKEIVKTAKILYLEVFRK